MHALQEEPIADQPILTDVGPSYSNHTSYSDHISNYDGAKSDLNENEFANIIARPIWPQLSL